MIASIEIENLRGIRHGRLEGLAPLTILTGPNASGKSTVLDALLIAASPDPVDGIVRAVTRHPMIANGARWLLQDDKQARVELHGRSRRVRNCHLEWTKSADHELFSRLRQRGSQPPFGMVQVSTPVNSKFKHEASVLFGSDNDFERFPSNDKKTSLVPRVELVDPGIPVPLHEVFSEVSQSGRREGVHELLGRLVPDFERLEIIALGRDRFGLAITSAGRSIPIAAAGDGIQAFVQLVLSIAIDSKGLVLVEEPEVYQHPRAIWQSALALLENVRRGVQMVVTTHSLELIDAILSQAEETLGDIVLFNLLLEEGELKSGRRVGDEITFARQTLEHDLR